MRRNPNNKKGVEINMCMLAHGRNLNKGKVDMVETFDQIFRSGLEAKLDNIFEINGYRIRRYVDYTGKAIVIIKKIEPNIPERKVQINTLYDPIEL